MSGAVAGRRHPYTRRMPAAEPLGDLDGDAASNGRGFEPLIAELASGLIVSAGDELDSGIERALARIVRFYRADRSTLFRLTGSPADAAAEAAATSGRDMAATDSWAIEGVARLSGVFGSEAFPWSLAAVLRGESIELDPVAGRPAEAAADLASCRRWGVRSVIATPLVSAGRVVGALAIGQVHERRSWSATERGQLATVAGLFASAVARRHSHHALIEAHRRLETAQASFRQVAATALQAQEEERRRVARELHDDVVQRLVSLSLSLDLAGADPAVAQEARAIAETVHGLSRSLHPRLVESLGLAGAIESEIASFRERFSGEVSLHLGSGRDGAASIPRLHQVSPEVAAVGYRVLQEALRNVLKHAEATQVVIRCRIEGPHLRLEIEDDGRGFDPSAFSLGLGLTSIAERVALVGGESAFGRAGLGGAAIAASMPLEAASREGAVA